MMAMTVQLDVKLWWCMRVGLIVGGAFSHAFYCRFGMAPIHRAAYQGYSSALELLIAKNADVNVQDK
jgi:hypothetical protein